MEEWRWSLCLGVFVVNQLGGRDTVLVRKWWPSARTFCQVMPAIANLCQALPATPPPPMCLHAGNLLNRSHDWAGVCRAVVSAKTGGRPQMWP